MVERRIGCGISIADRRLDFIESVRRFEQFDGGIVSEEIDSGLRLTDGDADVGPDGAHGKTIGRDHGIEHANGDIF